MQVIRDTAFYATPAYVLRWRFTYADGRQVASHWCDDERRASREDRAGLIEASIDVMSRHGSRIIYEVATCAGDDFVEFRWMRCPSLSPVFGHFDAARMLGEIHGIVLVSRTERITIFIDGSARVANQAGVKLWKDVVSGCSSRSRC